MAEVKTTKELNDALAALPEFSRKVYDAIHAGLYAEPGFSDVTATDVAKTLGCPAKAVNAAVKHLIAVGLVWSFEFDAPYMTVLGTFEHSEEISR